MDQEKETQSVETGEAVEEQNRQEEATVTVEEKPEKSKKKKEKKTAAQAELESLQAEFQALQDRFMRTCAEYDNFRKRSQSEKQQAYNNALADAVSAILPVQDNIDRALSQEQITAESMVKGLEMIASQFASSFEALGVKSVGERGEPFNPELHDAVSHIESDDLAENTIAAVLQKGFILKDEKVIRHAMVQVAN